MEKLMLVTILILGSIFGMSEQQSQHVKVSEALSFKKENAKTNVRLLAMRTAKDYNSDLIKNAFKITVLNQNTLTTYAKELDL
jgi:hypothetical protein